MNRENEVSDSQQREDAGRDPLHELEATLRSLRPRAPQVATQSLRGPLDHHVTPPTASLRGSNSQPGPAPRAWAVKVAAAGVCGALVGGLAVFLVMQPRIASLQAIVEHRSPASPVGPNAPAEHKPAPLDYDAETSPRDEPNDQGLASQDIVTGLNKPPVDAWSQIAIGRGDGTLAAGSHLRPLARRLTSAARDEPTTTRTSHAHASPETGWGETQSPLTRAQLLEELLGTTPRTL